MAATAIAEQTVAGPYTHPDDSKFTTLVPGATDPTNKNKVVASTGRVLLLFTNSDPSDPYWATVEGTNDPYGRSTDTGQQDIPAAGGWVGRIFEARGWEQTTGGRDIQFDTENVAILALAIPI